MPKAHALDYRAAYIPEVTPGTTPAAALTILRTQGGGGRTTFQTTESRETHLGEVPFVARTLVEGAGRYPFELSYGMLDDFLVGILGGAWATNVAKVASTRRTFTFEDQYTDAAKFVAYRYAVLEQLSLNIQKGAVITGGLSFKSLPGVPGTATVGTGPATAAPTNDVMACPDSVRLIQENGVAVPGFIGMTMELTRPVLSADVANSPTADELRGGKFRVRGTLSFYEDGETAIEGRYTNFTTTSLAINLGDASNRRYNFLMSKVKLTDGGRQEVAEDQYVIRQYNYVAFFDATNSTLQVTRVP